MLSAGSGGGFKSHHNNRAFCDFFISIIHYLLRLPDIITQDFESVFISCTNYFLKCLLLIALKFQYAVWLCCIPLQNENALTLLEIS